MSVLGSIKANSFYMTLLVLGVITAAIVFFITACFCCSYCCRQPVGSRGSSKDALNPADDGEFRWATNKRRDWPLQLDGSDSDMSSTGRCFQGVPG